MPRYHYKCNKCERELYEIREAIERETSKGCGSRCDGTLTRLLPMIFEPTIMETVDTHRNVQHRKDQDKRIKKRAKDFFMKHEMNEAIAKAGEEEAKKYGWITGSGKKNKGD